MNSQKIYEEVQKSNELLSKWLEVINANIITTNKILKEVFKDKLKKE